MHHYIMKKLSFLILPLLLIGCNVYEPIIHVNRYYPPTEFVRILSEPPMDYSGYFGTIKVVPADGSVPTRKDVEKAIECLKETAKNCGAHSMYIRNYDPNYSDMMFLKFIDTHLSGSGAVLDAELYR